MIRSKVVTVAVAVLLLAALCTAANIRTRREVVMHVTDDNYEQQLTVLGDGVGFYHDGTFDSGCADRLSVYRDLVYDVNCSTDPDLCYDNRVRKQDRPAVLVHKNRKIVGRTTVADITSNELFDWAADLLAGKITQANPDHESEDRGVVHSGYVFIEYYAYWCGHCKAFSPVIRELSFLMENTNVSIVRVECSDNKNFCSEKGIEGYPTIQLLHDGDIIAPYDGDRTDAQAVADWIHAHIAEYEGETEQGEAEEV